ncbi:MAG: hypothetical protein RSB86_16735 [Comamonas sp.]|uniref:hypothetical protein n=1 Tax=Comamonas sp. TaxID=34028 RepID=UPI002FC77B01
MTTPEKPKGYWKQNAKLLAEQAKTLSNNQLAVLHNTTNTRMRCQLSKLGIKAAKHASGREARNAELAKLALTHTPRQIADASGKTIRAIYQELKRYGIQAQQSIPGICAKRSIKLAEDAKTMTTRQLADEYGLELQYMYKLLARFGITAMRGRSGPAPGTERKQPVVRNTAPATDTAQDQQPQLRKPATQSVVKKAPAAIVWPSHIQVQHIALPQPPADYRICNGSSKQAYVPAKGWGNGPRAI